MGNNDDRVLQRSVRGVASSDSLSEQTDWSILPWNPGPNRGSRGASKIQTAGLWHVVAFTTIHEVS